MVLQTSYIAWFRLNLSNEEPTTELVCHIEYHCHLQFSTLLLVT